MACLNITTGPFNVGSGWLGAVPPVTTPNGATITNTAGSGLSVQKGGDTEVFTIPPSGSVRFMTFGSPANFILVLTSSPTDRSVVLVDTTGASITTELIAPLFSATSATALPRIETSAGNGSVFLLVSPRSTGDVAAAIFRSDNGSFFCSVVPFPPTLQITGEATTSLLVIKHGGTVVASATRPTGVCQVTPEPNNFGSLPVGAGVPPALSTVTRQFTVRNTGTDCLTVNSTGDIAPYTRVGTSVPLPVILDPSQQVIIDVRFSPTAVGTFNRDLPLSTTPVQGDNVLMCRGMGRNPLRTISIIGTFAYGSVPVSTSVTRNLQIRNTGEVDITINLPASAAGSEFQWTAFTGTITPGNETPNIPITFTPVSEGPKAATLTFTSNATGSPHNVSLSGSGCVANAEMILPAAPLPSFGNVQRGFRTVRLFRVRNTGDGQLTFTARIAGTDAALFGIQPSGGSITSPVSVNSYAVSPVTGCGSVATGTGEEIVALTFYANDVPRTAQAQLIIESHNATNGIPATVTFDLAAEITAPISIDVELVLDRSGSMADMAGERTKSETAISAGKLFVQLARPDVEDRIGVVKFNDVPEVVSSIQNITSGNQTAVSDAINGTNFNPTGFTSIAGGVLVAQNDMIASPRTTLPALLNKAIVVLTDGIDNTPYTNPADGITYSLAGGNGTTQLPAFADIRLYAIGFGRNEDIDIGQLSLLAQATGGDFLTVQNFSGEDFFGLEKHFTQIYMDSVDLATIRDPVFIIQPGDTHINEFDVLRGDTSVMVVIYDRDGIRLPFYLEAPNGEMIDITFIPSGYQIRSGITPTARFIELQMPPNEPDRYAGRWKLILKHDNRACVFSRNSAEDDFGFGFQPKKCREYDKAIMYGFAIGVGSNFRMMPYVQPGIIKTGESIRLTADVTEFGLPVTGCLVTVEVLAPDGTVSNLVLFDDGSHQDDEANDGYYGNLFTNTFVGGSYQFTYRTEGISRDGESVFREAVRSKYVEGRVPIDPEDNPNTGGGDEKCCRQTYTLIRIIIVLLMILILFLIYLIVYRF